MAFDFEYRVHPAVGIARMGNSKTTYFLTSEKPQTMLAPVQERIPGTPTDKRAAGIRDADGHLCKQGARFRVFCYQYRQVLAVGQPPKRGALMNVRECTKDKYSVQWTVQVANRKSVDAGGTTASPRKPNAPDPVTLPSGAASARRMFTGKPLGRLELGSAFVDGDGRLIVLGSNGAAKRIAAGGVPNTPEPLFWAGFEDDAADGPVTAVVTPTAAGMPDSSRPAAPAIGGWVVIGVPAYGGDARATVNLNDVAINHAYELAKTDSFPGRRPATHPLWLGDLPASPAALDTWHRQIKPLLRAQYTVPYTIKHHTGRRIPFILPAYVATNPEHSYWLRPGKTTIAIKPEDIWASTDPLPAPPYRAIGANGLNSMPQLRYLSITEMQYKAVTNWAAGTLSLGSGVPETSAAVLYRPYQLDLAHMETMSGGSFYPGIEVGRQAHWPKTWRGRPGCCDQHYDARVTREVSDANADVGPAQAGYLTARLACPWQADFVACDGSYWPHSRPIAVRLVDSGPYMNWMSDAGGPISSHTGVSAAGVVTGGLADKWWQLGFVRLDPTVSNPTPEMIEIGRTPGLAMAPHPAP